MAQLRRLPEVALRGLMISNKEMDNPGDYAIVERSNRSIAVTTRTGGYNLYNFRQAMDYYARLWDQKFSEADRRILQQTHLFLEAVTPKGIETDVFHIFPRFREPVNPPQGSSVDWFIRGETTLLRATNLLEPKEESIVCGVNTVLLVASGRLKGSGVYHPRKFHLGTILQITAISGDPHDFRSQRGQQATSEVGKLIQRFSSRRLV